MPNCIIFLNSLPIMASPMDNTEVVRMFRDVKKSLLKPVTPLKDEYVTGVTDNSGIKQVAAKLNFSFDNDSQTFNESTFLQSYQTPSSLKRRLMVQEAELQASNAKLKERESLISILEPANKKLCTTLENKLEKCRKQTELDSQKIEELRANLKWVKSEASFARSQTLEIERQKKIDMDKLELQIVALKQECSNLKVEMADIKSEKTEAVRKLNVELGRLELKVSMLSEEAEKSQDYIQSLKRQNNELTDKASLSCALQKELKEALDKIKEMENKIELDKDAALIVSARQSELKLLADLQKENQILKEEVSKNKENNIALYQEKIWNIQEKLKLSEKKVLSYARLQSENEQLKSKIAQWEGLFDDKSTPFKSPTTFSRRLSQYQKNEAVLTNKLSEISSHCETLKKENADLKEKCKLLNQRIDQFQLTSPRQESLIKRLQRKLLFLTKERDNCRKLLDSYLSETTSTGAVLYSEHIKQLENMNNEYKRALERNETELENVNENLENVRLEYRELLDSHKKEVGCLNEKIKTLTENYKTDVLAPEVKKLRDENSSLLAHIAELKKENAMLESECSKQGMENDNDAWTGKILHLRFNPLDNAINRNIKTLEKLKEENDNLKKRIKVLEEEGATATDVTLKVEQKLIHEGADSTLKSLQDKLVAAERQQRFILENARIKSTEFREAVYRLTGYRIDVPTTKKYKLSHVYAESKDDYLLFQIDSDGVQLIETEYSKQLTERMELYLHQHDSFPAFLASLTMDLFSQQTYFCSQ